MYANFKIYGWIGSIIKNRYFVFATCFENEPRDEGLWSKSLLFVDVFFCVLLETNALSFPNFNLNLSVGSLVMC